MLGVHTPVPGMTPQSSSPGCSPHSSPALGWPLYGPKGGRSLLTHSGTAQLPHGLFSKSAYFLRLWLKTMREEQASAFLKIKR